MAEDQGRDYIGDQIGWSLRRLLPPEPQIYQVDKFIMTHIPRNLARAVVLIREKLNLLPDRGDAYKAYFEFCGLLGTSYVDNFGLQRGINTLTMNVLGQLVTCQATSYKMGEREIKNDWGKQVSWALGVEEKKIDWTTDDLKEAATILQFQKSMEEFYAQLQPKLIKRGIPIVTALVDPAVGDTRAA